MSADTPSPHWLETYKSLIAISIEGFKFCALANGGAAVALLAYLGNMTNRGAGAPDMRYPMAAFLAGLVACGAAMIFSYLTQLKLLNELSQPNHRPSHGWLLWAAVLLVILSIAAFATGSWQAVIRFR